MAYPTAYSHVTVARIPRASWEQAWFSLVSYKGYLGSVPGFLAIRLGARETEDGDVHIHVATWWDDRPTLDEWIGGPWVPRVMFEHLEEPGEVISEEILEEYT